jgi:hypothetical protein
MAVHPNYGQPPCDFYFQVMAKFRKAIVLGDTYNPCVWPLIKKGAVPVPFDDSGNLALLLAAKYVALAKSSRSHVILALSFVWKQFWAFDLEYERSLEPTWWVGFTPLEFGDGVDCVASQGFRNALRHWMASQSQKARVMNGTCEFRPIKCLGNVKCPVRK